MNRFGRRHFLVRSGTVLGFTAAGSDVGLLAKPVAAPEEKSKRASSAPQATKLPQDSAPLYNTNLQTAIGLGDEPPGILDKFGQLASRNAEVRLEIGSPPQPVSKAEWSQSLQDGYLPIVDTQVRTPQGSLGWVAFSSDSGEVKVDYVGVKESAAAHRITMRFPSATSIKVDQGIVSSGDKVLALFPPAKKVAVSQAKYNYLTPQAWPLEPPIFEPARPAKPLPGLDPAFNNGRSGFLNRGIEYRFPVTSGKTYHVYLGLLRREETKPGEMVVKLSVNGESQVVDVGLAGAAKPILRKFVVQQTQGEIRVKSECDASSTAPYRGSLLNGIWIFEAPAEPEKVIAGKLSQTATFYVQCGNEPLHDIASSVALDYEPQTGSASTRWFRLPYDSKVGDVGKLSAVAPEAAQAAVKGRWDAFLQTGAEFTAGNRRLDDLYKTSLINIFLMRSKCPGAGSGGQDIYVVKPGATIYDAFWYRDGAYLVAALDVAGHTEEAEKSLRLFWQPNLPGILGAYGQQANGVWQAPIMEWDGQGQALWAMVNHFELTQDKKWLRDVYASIRKGALWIKSVTEETQILNENGEKPIYYGLLPPGEGEAIGQGYMYYHNFWAVLGLREAIVAAEALREEKDLVWMKQTYEEYCANLLASVKLAYQRVGNNEFIPASPFDPNIDIWGSMTALYPARFLDAHDPMMSSTLDRMAKHSQEDEYTFFVTKKLWTYITADWAMCYLLRNDLPMFYRLFDGYVAHASPTNVWIEEIFLDSHLGTGDMPHGWAAAQYVLIYRNCLVYENGKYLELCWGVQPDWIAEGAKLMVKKAPTKFGSIQFELERSGTTLVLNYTLVPAAGQTPAEAVRLHIPAVKERITTVRVNGKDRALSPGEAVIGLT